MPDLGENVDAATVKITFPTAAEARMFLTFLDCYGEQTYWEWMASGDHGPYSRRFNYDKAGLTAVATNPR